LVRFDHDSFEAMLGYTLSTSPEIIEGLEAIEAATSPTA
jgi:hypothetical protein